ncbi:TolC family outer membrane protein [Marinicella rhabdoformis]|uniref:TolC family outer membrane protein n=1 Tax=Marinicella rhabdoformis TaxID=2580566 RepID=UPI0012AEC9EA|nr:TolC family outer membrane protein [Marinicella rhabdoformis]
MKKTLILSAILGTSAVHAENLNEVLNIALENDPQLKAAQYTQQASKESKKQAWANFMPQVSGTWSKSKSINNEQTFGRFGTIESPDSSSNGWNVTLNQTVYDHTNFLRLRQGDLDVAKGQADYDAAEQDFLIRVSQSYFDVLTQIDAVSFAEAEKKAIQRQLDQAEQRYEVGLAAITDVHEARAQYDGARASVINAKNLLDDKKEALFEITQTNFSDLNALPEDIAELPLSNPNLTYWESLGLENNPNLGAAKINAELAELDFKNQRAGHLPTVGLRATHRNDTDNDITLASPDDPDNFITDDRKSEGQSISLNVSIPIFSGGRTSSLSRQSKLRYKAAMQNLDQTNYSTVRNIRNALHNVESGWSSVQARKLAMVSAQSAEEATTAGFEVGTRNIVEVLNSQRGLYQAQRDYSRAKHDYLMNILKLKRAAGVLKQQDISEINQLLIAE